MTGYIVHYRTGSFIETDIESVSSTSIILSNLIGGGTYTVSVEATSQQLSGESEEMTITLRAFSMTTYALIYTIAI